MADQIFLLDAGKTTLRALTRTTVQALAMKEVDVEALFAKLGGRLFGRDLLWIARQTWASDDQRSDLLGVDRGGALVVAELKRGNAGPDSLTQALGYVAHYSQRSVEQLAELWLETGKKASGIVAEAPATLDDAWKRLKERAPDGEPNTDQVVLLVAETFDDGLLTTCNYLGKTLSDSLRVECWEYALHPLPDAGAGYVLTLRQVVPSRTVNDEIAARQEARGDKPSRRRTLLKHQIAGALMTDGWQTTSEGAWYSLSIRQPTWASEQMSIEFKDGDRPVLYLSPGLGLQGALPAGIDESPDWTDAKDASVWKRYVLPFASTASYDASHGAMTRALLAKVVRSDAQPGPTEASPAAPAPAPGTSANGA